VSFVTWTDKVGGSLTRLKVNALGHYFKVGPAGTQGMLIADEYKEVMANRIVSIKVRQIDIPKSSIVLPTFWVRHPLGFAVGAVEAGLPKSIDERRMIDEIVFYPVADGKVQANDVLGAVNILYAQPQYEYGPPKEAATDYLRNRYWFG
jgi:hypothetical protein